MTTWRRLLQLLQRTGITYTLAFYPPYGTDIPAVRHACRRAGLRPFILRGVEEGTHTRPPLLQLTCLRQHAFHAALILAALNCDFTPPPPDTAPRPSRPWGTRALRALHLPDDIANMLLDAYTSPPP